MHKNKSEGFLAVPEYPLSEVCDLIEQGKVFIYSKARDSARNDFGWDYNDVIQALKKLKKVDFYKRDTSENNAWLVLDFYKAVGLCGENVYTHFYIDRDENVLVINSFKRIER